MSLFIKDKTNFCSFSDTNHQYIRPPINNKGSDLAYPLTCNYGIPAHYFLLQPMTKLQHIKERFMKERCIKGSYIKERFIEDRYIKESYIKERYIVILIGRVQLRFIIE